MNLKQAREKDDVKGFIAEREKADETCDKKRFDSTLLRLSKPEKEKSSPIQETSLSDSDDC